MSTAYQAYATGGFKVTADTPRQAALDFFARFPTKRKCNVIEGTTGDGFFTVTYGRIMPKSYPDVTKKSLYDLPHLAVRHGVANVST